MVGVGGICQWTDWKGGYECGYSVGVTGAKFLCRVTNKLLAKKAAKICVAYEGMERFFQRKRLYLQESGAEGFVECRE